ncbi:hypothetical protein NDU88_005715 [Pleurodeles waltl]|uniref:Uncharacterized protein n=1 Tax=Pleurodeles waltl TaxID=8319 RepID=A0AAV7W8L2_PLEWA|nr:hypothetical protein NDU88_005715 [Pleurodeles waltl]
MSASISKSFRQADNTSPGHQPQESVQSGDAGIHGGRIEAGSLSSPKRCQVVSVPIAAHLSLGPRECSEAFLPLGAAVDRTRPRQFQNLIGQPASLQSVTPRRPEPPGSFTPTACRLPRRPWRPSPLEESKAQDPLTNMLDPEDLIHPRSSEWFPSDKVSKYVAGRLRKPLDKEVRACLKVECLLPYILGKVALTPELDPRMATFLQNDFKAPEKGIDRS